jgi:hypothetical protein
MDEYNFTPPPLTSRYVAICDVLGFKHKLQTLTLAELAGRYHLLTLRVLHLVRSTNTLFPDSPKKSDFVHHAIISDTCLLWSAALTPEESPLDWGTTSAFFDTCNLLIIMGLTLDMPFRIGVSYGQVCIAPDRGLFVGTPISDAYALEQSQNWIGGACHNSCTLAPSFASVTTRLRDVLPYDVPLHSGRADLHALNWPRLTDPSILDALAPGLQLSAENPARQKYLEAATFFERVRKLTGPLKCC